MDMSSQRRSENVEDYRDSTLGSILARFGISRPQDIGESLTYAMHNPFTPQSFLPAPPAPPGSLPDQAGVNDISAMVKALSGGK